MLDWFLEPNRNNLSNKKKNLLKTPITLKKFPKTILSKDFKYLALKAVGAPRA